MKGSARRLGPTTASQIYLRDGRSPKPALESTSRVMRANRSRDTGPELLLRSALTAMGVRGYRLHSPSLPGRPDLSFGRAGLAVFVNGCFWHRCPHCKKGLPKTHTDYWKAKFSANVQRDARKAQILRRRGWRVLVVWECEVDANPVKSAARVARRLSRPTSGQLRRRPYVREGKL